VSSLFETDFLGGGWELLLSVHGESVSITPVGGSVSSVSAIFEPRRIIDGYFPDGELSESFAVLRVKASAITNWTPRTGDKVVARGVTYAVDAMGPSLPVVELQLVAHEQRRLGGDASRIKR
jgi:hypothetical protein